MTEDEDDVIAMAMREAQSRDDQVVDDESADVDVGDVKSVAELVSLQIKLEGVIAALEEEMKRLTKELEDVRTRKLPDAMLEMNVSSWTTTVGDRKLTVKLDRVFYPSVSKDDMPSFVSWLKERGDDGIVKPKFVVDFEKGETDRAEELLNVMREEHPELPISYAPEIHWSTFRSYTKEVVTGGVELPPFYKYHEANVAKITSRKI